MIIDSHAHYSHFKFDGSFPCLSMGREGAEILETRRESLFEALRSEGIAAVVEPAIDLESNKLLLALSREQPGFIFPAVGLHPTRSPAAKWSQRRELIPLARDSSVVAIGETGLDYHLPRKEQQRFTQLCWFIYQIKLAHKMNLPLILHIRDAHQDAIKVLRLCRRFLRGGVVHCFVGDWATAEKYLALGLHFGIGGPLLQNNERGEKLREAVKHIPLERILAETDSPYVLPSLNGLYTKKEAKGLRNSSLILPAVISKIAELKSLSYEETESALYNNTVRLFRLELPAGRQQRL